MKEGNITCSCGQFFNVESMNNAVNCIKCGIPHDISNFPEKVEEVEFTEENQNGTEGV